MTDRVVVVEGLSSQLLFGDDDFGQSRFQVNVNGNSVSAALPLLLKEGWKVKLAVPAPMTATIIFVLESGDGEGEETGDR